MKWIEYNGGNLKQGSICRMSEGDFIMVGEINNFLGKTNEFLKSMTHYTEYFCNDISSKLKYAELNYNR